MEINKVEKEINIFLKAVKEKGAAESTLLSKRRHLFVFLEFLKENNLLDNTISRFRKKDFDKFEKFLTEKKIKETTKKNYMSTVFSFLFYFNTPGFIKEKKEEETDIQRVVNYYFQTKGYSIEEIKNNAKKRNIIYSRHTKPAKDLLHLAGSLDGAKKAIDRVADWANSRNLDYAIETVFKKWPEINRLKPKEKKKKAYYRKDPMIWSNTKQKWFVITKNGDWLEFAGEENDIEWREE